jgi:hypothetical protein
MTFETSIRVLFSSRQCPDRNAPRPTLDTRPSGYSYLPPSAPVTATTAVTTMTLLPLHPVNQFRPPLSEAPAQCSAHSSGTVNVRKRRAKAIPSNHCIILSPPPIVNTFTKSLQSGAMPLTQWGQLWEVLLDARTPTD